MSSHDFKIALRQPFDFPTRWGSTLFIIKRYISIKLIFKDAHKALVREQHGWFGDFGKHLSATEIVFAWRCGPYFDWYLRRNCSFLTKKWIKYSFCRSTHRKPGCTFGRNDKNGASSQMDSILRNYVSRRRRSLFNTFPIIQIMLHVGSLLNLMYRRFLHLKYLGGKMVYLMSLERATNYVQACMLLHESGWNRTTCHQKQSKGALSLNRLLRVFENDGGGADDDGYEWKIINETVGCNINARATSDQCPL